MIPTIPFVIFTIPSAHQEEPAPFKLYNSSTLACVYVYVLIARMVSWRHYNQILRSNKISEKKSHILILCTRAPPFVMNHAYINTNESNQNLKSTLIYWSIFKGHTWYVAGDQPLATANEKSTIAVCSCHTNQRPRPGVEYPYIYILRSMIP